jgi:hypothetical protein
LKTYSALRFDEAERGAEVGASARGGADVEFVNGAD